MKYKECYKFFRTPQYGKLTVLTVAGTLILFAATGGLFPEMASFVKWLLYSGWIIFVLFLGKPTGKPEEAVKLIVKSLIRVLNNGYEPGEILHQLENIIKMAVYEWSFISDAELDKYIKEKQLGGYKNGSNIVKENRVLDTVNNGAV